VDLKGRPVQFIGIDIKDNDDSALAFEREYSIDYPSISSNESGPAMLTLGRIIPTSAVPSTVIVDRFGQVAARVVGVGTYTTFSALIEPLLAEQP